MEDRRPITIRWGRENMPWGTVICSLLNDTASNSDYSVEWSWIINFKGYGRKWSWTNLRYYTRIWPQGLPNTTKILVNNSLYLNLKQGTSLIEYRSVTASANLPVKTIYPEKGNYARAGGIQNNFYGTWAAEESHTKIDPWKKTVFHCHFFRLTRHITNLVH